MRAGAGLIPDFINHLEGGPKPSRYDKLKRTGIASELLLHKAETLERLAHHKQHPNIIRYHGCIVERDRIVGIVPHRHPITLQQRFTCDPRMFDKDLCIKKIESAVEHINSLRLANNDLKHYAQPRRTYYH